MNYADGTIFYRPDRQKWIAVLDGYQQAARNTVEACRNFLINKRFTGPILVIEIPQIGQVSISTTNTPNTSDNIQDWIKTETKTVIDQANNMFGLTLNPTIEFCRGRAAGWAKGTGLMKFNTILASENKEEFPQVIKHEVAHLVVNAKYKMYRFFRRIRPHGPEFMTVLKQLGGRPERCHKMDTTNATIGRRSTKKFLVKCNCKTHMVTARTLNKLAFYKCKKCKGALIAINP